MRQFTEKDKIGLARALQTFLSYCNGQQTTIKTHLKQIDRVLEEGITVDELLNRSNYDRACTISPDASVEEYVDILIERSVPVLELKDELGWDEPSRIQDLAAVFHDYYLEVCSKGGTWSTLTAKLNLQRVINRNSLQAIMSETLVNEVKELSGQKDDLTCFQYIQNLLNKQEDYFIDKSLSEQQRRRREIDEIITEPKTEQEQTAEEAETQPQPNAHAELETESIPDPDDTSLYDEPFEMTYDDDDIHDTYIASIKPNEFKRAHITDALMNLTINEILELSKSMEEDISLDELITKLSNGQLDRKKLSIEGRNIHQIINGSLYPHFLACVTMQGVEISEATAVKMDLLCESWDMRDVKTRKLQKLKELVLGTDMQDSDLLAIIEDLQDYYSEKQ